MTASLRAELPDQPVPEIGQELIRVTHPDGRVEELRLHDYERLYALPGAYEQIVQKRLGCTSPGRIARMLASAFDGLGRPRSQARVLDVAAGNGVSGEALAAEGLTPVLGTDLVPVAREAALRDRPGLYGAYLTLDLLRLSDDEAAAVRAARANALSCVAPVGDIAGQVPVAALMAAVALLDLEAPGALVAYMHEPRHATPDGVKPERFREALGDRVEATEVARERYVHRTTLGGDPYEMEGVVWRVIVSRS